MVVVLRDVDDTMASPDLGSDGCGKSGALLPLSDFRNRRLKLLTKVVDGPLAVLGAVPSRGTLLGQKASDAMTLTWTEAATKAGGSRALNQNVLPMVQSGEQNSCSPSEIPGPKKPAVYVA